MKQPLAKAYTMLHRKHVDAKGNWVTFRPDIKIMDCTIRDGGLMNDHQFDETFVKAVYDTCVAAGVDYCELGYKGLQAHLRAGRTRGLEVLRRGYAPPHRGRGAASDSPLGDG